MIPMTMVGEPFIECMLLGVCAAFSTRVLFGFDPIVVFLIHLLIWCIMDWLLLRSIQVTAFISFSLSVLILTYLTPWAALSYLDWPHSYTYSYSMAHPAGVIANLQGLQNNSGAWNSIPESCLTFCHLCPLFSLITVFFSRTNESNTWLRNHSHPFVTHFLLFILQGGPLPFNKFDYVMAWLFRETSAPFLFCHSIFSPTISWRDRTYRLQWGGKVEEILPKVKLWAPSIITIISYNSTSVNNTKSNYRAPSKGSTFNKPLIESKFQVKFNPFRHYLGYLFMCH